MYDISIDNKTTQHIIDNLNTVHNNQIISNRRCICGSGNVELQEYQLRSSDEAATTMMRCNTCGKIEKLI